MTLLSRKKPLAHLSSRRTLSHESECTTRVPAHKGAARGVALHCDSPWSMSLVNQEFMRAKRKNRAAPLTGTNKYTSSPVQYQLFSGSGGDFVSGQAACWRASGAGSPRPARRSTSALWLAHRQSISRAAIRAGIPKMPGQPDSRQRRIRHRRVNQRRSNSCCIQMYLLRCPGLAGDGQDGPFMSNRGRRCSLALRVFEGVCVLFEFLIGHSNGPPNLTPLCNGTFDRA